jgi:2-polyprenyl-6-methoxyphenol hydroxylase-like FAD-dependent oxidoreductase
MSAVRQSAEPEIREVVVVGGSVAGLASALALAGAGRSVTVLERDAAPLPADPAEAFSGWRRPGSPQTRHSHAFLARLHNLLRDRAPRLLDEIFAAGASALRFRDIVARALPGAPLLPGDDDITLIACRRLTFEWTLRRHVEALPGVRMRSGCSVAGLVAGADAGRPPHVRGVRLADGTTLAADLVVDASGRRSRIRAWLAELGAAVPREESETCGIFYSSRFYRLREGAQMPVLDGPMGADLGFLKYGIFPGDARSFSITLAASPDDAPLRALFRQSAFEALAAALPATAPWVDPAVAVPISGVVAMANLRNTRRFLVEDGEPVATGIACVGDALVHTNPIVGRGCTLAFVNAYLLADAVSEHPRDPRALATALDARVQAEIAPWYEAVRAQDRDAILVAEAIRAGRDPYAPNRPDGSVDPAGYLRSLLRDGFVPALREDVVVLRAFMRIFNLLDAPADLMRDPSFLARVLGVYQRRYQREPLAGPSRDEVVSQLAAA